MKERKYIRARAHVEVHWNLKETRTKQVISRKKRGSKTKPQSDSTQSLRYTKFAFYCAALTTLLTLLSVLPYQAAGHYPAIHNSAQQCYTSIEV